MNTRCKFRCESVTDHGTAKDVRLNAVTGTSEENKDFWKFTPSGKLELTWINPNVDFKPGKEYYLDIREADVEPQEKCTAG